MAIHPKITFSSTKHSDLRGVHVPWTIEEVAAPARVIIDAATTFADATFRERLLQAGAIDLENKESLQGQVIHRFDFRGMDFAGFDLFSTEFRNCQFDSITSFEGAYVHDTLATPSNIDFRQRGAVVFGPSSKSIHGHAVIADLDLSVVGSLAGSSLVGTTMELSDVVRASTRRTIRSALSTAFTDCLFDDTTRFPATIRDGEGNIDPLGIACESCDTLLDAEAQTTTMRMKILTGTGLASVGALPIHAMPCSNADDALQQFVSTQTVPRIQDGLSAAKITALSSSSIEIELASAIDEASIGDTVGASFQLGEGADSSIAQGVWTVTSVVDEGSVMTAKHAGGSVSVTAGAAFESITIPIAPHSQLQIDVASAEAHSIVWCVAMDENGALVGADALVFEGSVDLSGEPPSSATPLRIASYAPSRYAEKAAPKGQITLQVHGSVREIMIGTDAELLKPFLSAPAEGDAKILYSAEVSSSSNPPSSSAEIEIPVHGAHAVSCAFSIVAAGSAPRLAIACGFDAPLPSLATAESLGMIRPRLDSQGPPTNMQAKVIQNVAWQGIFEHANFRACHFSSCDLRHASFRHCDFSGASFAGCLFGETATGSTFEGCLINGETQLGSSCTVTKYASTKTSAEVEAPDDEFPVLNADALPESGTATVGRERFRYEKVNGNLIRATSRGVEGSLRGVHDASSVVTVVEIVEAATFLDVFFNVPRPCVDIHDVPPQAPVSGTVLPIINRRRLEKPVRSLKVTKVTDPDGDYLQYIFKLGAVSGDLFAGDADCYITHAGQTVRVRDLVRITLNGRAGELTDFMGTCREAEIVAAHGDADKEAYSDSQNALYDPTLRAEIDASVSSLELSPGFFLYAMGSRIMNSRISETTIRIGTSSTVTFEKCDFSGTIYFDFEDHDDDSRIGHVIFQECNIADTIFASNLPHREAFPEQVTLINAADDSELTLDRSPAGSLETEFAVWGLTKNSDNGKRYFEMVPDEAFWSQSDSMKSQIRSTMPTMFAQHHHDYPFRLPTAALGERVAVYIDSERSHTGKPRVEVLSSVAITSATVNGISMVSMEGQNPSPAGYYCWGTDLSSLAAEYTVTVDGQHQLIAQPFRPGPQSLLTFSASTSSSDLDAFFKIADGDAMPIENEGTILEQPSTGARAYIVHPAVRRQIIPEIEITGAGSGAKATAVVDATSTITSITVEEPGEGYVAAGVHIGGLGTGAEYAVSAMNSEGEIVSLTKLSEGTGYVAAELQAVDRYKNRYERYIGSRPHAVLKAVNDDETGQMTGIEVLDGGSGYSARDTIIEEARATGSGATYRVTVLKGLQLETALTASDGDSVRLTKHDGTLQDDDVATVEGSVSGTNMRVTVIDPSRLHQIHAKLLPFEAGTAQVRIQWAMEKGIDEGPRGFRFDTSFRSEISTRYLLSKKTLHGWHGTLHRLNDNIDTKEYMDRCLHRIVRGPGFQEGTRVTAVTGNTENGIFLTLSKPTVGSGEHGNFGVEVSVNGETSIVSYVDVTGPIQSVDVRSPGENYFRAPVTIEGNGVGAAAKAVVSADGKVTSMTLTNPGTGYVDVPNAKARLVGSDFHDADLTVNVDSTGKVESVSISSQKVGYLVHAVMLTSAPFEPNLPIRIGELANTVTCSAIEDVDSFWEPLAVQSGGKSFVHMAQGKSPSVVTLESGSKEHHGILPAISKTLRLRAGQLKRSSMTRVDRTIVDEQVMDVIVPANMGSPWTNSAVNYHYISIDAEQMYQTLLDLRVQSFYSATISSTRASHQNNGFEWKDTFPYAMDFGNDSVWFKTLENPFMEVSWDMTGITDDAGYRLIRDASIRVQPKYSNDPERINGFTYEGVQYTWRDVTKVRIRRAVFYDTKGALSIQKNTQSHLGDAMLHYSTTASNFARISFASAEKDNYNQDFRIQFPVHASAMHLVDDVMPILAKSSNSFRDRDFGNYDVRVIGDYVYSSETHKMGKTHGNDLTTIMHTDSLDGTFDVAAEWTLFDQSAPVGAWVNLTTSSRFPNSYTRTKNAAWHVKESRAPAFTMKNMNLFGVLNAHQSTIALTGRVKVDSGCSFVGQAEVGDGKVSTFLSDIGPVSGIEKRKVETLPGHLYRVAKAKSGDTIVIETKDRSTVGEQTVQLRIKDQDESTVTSSSHPLFRTIVDEFIITLVTANDPWQVGEEVLAGETTLPTSFRPKGTIVEKIDDVTFRIQAAQKTRVSFSQSGRWYNITTQGIAKRAKKIEAVVTAPGIVTLNNESMAVSSFTLTTTFPYELEVQLKEALLPKQEYTELIALNSFPGKYADRGVFTVRGQEIPYVSVLETTLQGESVAIFQLHEPTVFSEEIPTGTSVSVVSTLTEETVETVTWNLTTTVTYPVGTVLTAYIPSLPYHAQDSSIITFPGDTISLSGLAFENDENNQRCIIADPVKLRVDLVSAFGKSSGGEDTVAATRIHATLLETGTQKQIITFSLNSDGRYSVTPDAAVQHVTLTPSLFALNEDVPTVSVVTHGERTPRHMLRREGDPEWSRQKYEGWFGNPVAYMIQQLEEKKDAERELKEILGRYSTEPDFWFDLSARAALSTDISMTADAIHRDVDIDAIDHLSSKAVGTLRRDPEHGLTMRMGIVCTGVNVSEETIDEARLWGHPLSVTVQPTSAELLAMNISGTTLTTSFDIQTAPLPCTLQPRTLTLSDETSFPVEVLRTEGNLLQVRTTATRTLPVKGSLTSGATNINFITEERDEAMATLRFASSLVQGNYDTSSISPFGADMIHSISIENGKVAPTLESDEAFSTPTVILSTERSYLKVVYFRCPEATSSNPAYVTLGGWDDFDEGKEGYNQEEGFGAVTSGAIEDSEWMLAVIHMQRREDGLEPEYDWNGSLVTSSAYWNRLHDKPNGVPGDGVYSLATKTQMTDAHPVHNYRMATSHTQHRVWVGVDVSRSTGYTGFLEVYGAAIFPLDGTEPTIDQLLNFSPFVDTIDDGSIVTMKYEKDRTMMQNISGKVSSNFDGTIAAVASATEVRVYAKDEQDHWAQRGTSISIAGAGIGVELSDAGDLVAVASANGTLMFQQWNGTAWSERGQLSLTLETGEALKSFVMNGDATQVAVLTTEVRVWRWSGSEWAQHGSNTIRGNNQLANEPIETLDMAGDYIAVGSKGHQSIPNNLIYSSQAPNLTDLTVVHPYYRHAASWDTIQGGFAGVLNSYNVPSLSGLVERSVTLETSQQHISVAYFQTDSSGATDFVHGMKKLSHTTEDGTSIFDDHAFTPSSFSLNGEPVTLEASTWYMSVAYPVLQPDAQETADFNVVGARGMLYRLSDKQLIADNISDVKVYPPKNSVLPIQDVMGSVRAEFLSVSSTVDTLESEDSYPDLSITFGHYDDDAIRFYEINGDGVYAPSTKTVTNLKLESNIDTLIDMTNNYYAVSNTTLTGVDTYSIPNALGGSNTSHTMALAGTYRIGRRSNSIVNLGNDFTFDFWMNPTANGNFTGSNIHAKFLNDSGGRRPPLPGHLESATQTVLPQEYGGFISNYWFGDESNHDSNYDVFTTDHTGKASSASEQKDFNILKTELGLPDSSEEFTDDSYGWRDLGVFAYNKTYDPMAGEVIEYYALDSNSGLGYITLYDKNNNGDFDGNLYHYEYGMPERWTGQSDSGGGDLTSRTVVLRLKECTQDERSTGESYIELQYEQEYGNLYLVFKKLKTNLDDTYIHLPPINNTSSFASIPANQWSHVTIQKKGSVISMYSSNQSSATSQLRCQFAWPYTTSSTYPQVSDINMIEMLPFAGLAVNTPLIMNFRLYNTRAIHGSSTSFSRPVIFDWNEHQTHSTPVDNPEHYRLIDLGAEKSVSSLKIENVAAGDVTVAHSTDNASFSSISLLEDGRNPSTSELNVTQPLERMEGTLFQAALDNISYSESKVTRNTSIEGFENQITEYFEPGDGSIVQGNKTSWGSEFIGNFYKNSPDTLQKFISLTDHYRIVGTPLRALSSFSSEIWLKESRGTWKIEVKLSSKNPIATSDYALFKVERGSDGKLTSSIETYLGYHSSNPSRKDGYPKTETFSTQASFDATNFGHFAVTFEAGTFRFYYNGTEKSSLSMSGSFDAIESGVTSNVNLSDYFNSLFTVKFQAIDGQIYLSNYKLIGGAQSYSSPVAYSAAIDSTANTYSKTYDLEEEKRIDLIRQHSSSISLSKVEHSTDGSTFTQIGDTAHDLGAADLDWDPNISARYIRLSSATSGLPDSLAVQTIIPTEFSDFAQDVGARYIRISSASAFPANMAVTPIFYTAVGENPSVVDVDLEETKTVYKFSVAPLYSSALTVDQYMKTFTMESSLDGVTYTPVAGGMTFSAFDNTGPILTASRKRITLPRSVTARYFRITAVTHNGDSPALRAGDFEFATGDAVGATQDVIMTFSGQTLWGPALYKESEYNAELLLSRPIAVKSTSTVEYNGALRLFALENNVWTQQRNTIENPMQALFFTNWGNNHYKGEDERYDNFGAVSVAIADTGSKILLSSGSTRNDYNGNHSVHIYSLSYDVENGEWTDEEFQTEYVGSAIDINIQLLEVRHGTGDLHVDLHPSGKMMVARTDDYMGIFPLDDDEAKPTVIKSTHQSVALSGDGDHAVISDDSTMSVVDLEQNALFFADVTMRQGESDDTLSSDYGMVGEVETISGSSATLQFREPAELFGDGSYWPYSSLTNHFEREDNELHLFLNIPSIVQVEEEVDASLSAKMYLSGYEFSGKDLKNANAFGSDLKGLVLVGSDLSNADLRFARLTQEVIPRNMEYQRGSSFNIRPHTVYVDAHYPIQSTTRGGGAKTKRTSHLQNVNLTGADLSHADLRGADLSSATYDDSTTFTGAIYDDSTLWKDASIEYPDRSARRSSTKGTPPAGTIKIFSSYSSPEVLVVEHKNEAEYYGGRYITTTVLNRDYFLSYFQLAVAKETDTLAQGKFGTLSRTTLEYTPNEDNSPDLYYTDEFIMHAGNKPMIAKDQYEACLTYFPLVGLARSPDEIDWANRVFERIPEAMDMSQTPKALLPEVDGASLLDLPSFVPSARRLRDRVDMFPWILAGFHQRRCFDKEGLARYATYFLEQHPDGDATIVPDSSFERYVLSVAGIPHTDVASITVGCQREVGSLLDAAIVVSINRIGNPNLITLIAFAALDAESNEATREDDRLICSGETVTQDRWLSVPIPFEAARLEDGTLIDATAEVQRAGEPFPLYDGAKGSFLIKAFATPVTLVKATSASLTLQASLDNGVNFFDASAEETLTFSFQNTGVRLRAIVDVKGFDVSEVAWERTTASGQTIPLTAPLRSLRISDSGTYTVRYTLTDSGDGSTTVLTKSAKALVVPVALLEGRKGLAAMTPLPKGIDAKEIQLTVFAVAKDGSDSFEGAWHRKGVHDAHFSPVPLNGGAAGNYSVSAEEGLSTLTIRHIDARRCEERGARYEYRTSAPGIADSAMPVARTQIREVITPHTIVVREYTESHYSKPDLVNISRLDLRSQQSVFRCSASVGSYLHFDVVPRSNEKFDVEEIMLQENGRPITDRLAVNGEGRITVTGVSKQQQDGRPTTIRIIVDAAGTEHVRFREVSLTGIVGAGLTLTAPDCVGADKGDGIAHAWDSPNSEDGFWKVRTGIVTAFDGASNTVTIESGLSMLYDSSILLQDRITFFDDGHDYAAGGAPALASGMMESYNKDTGELVLSGVAGTVEVGQRWTSYPSLVQEEKRIEHDAESPPTLVNLCLLNKRLGTSHHVRYNITWINPANPAIHPFGMAKLIIRTIRQKIPRENVQEILRTVRLSASGQTIHRLAFLMSKYNFEEERAILLA